MYREVAPSMPLGINKYFSDTLDRCCLDVAITEIREERPDAQIIARLRHLPDLAQ